MQRSGSQKNMELPRYVKSYRDSFHGLSYRGGDTYSANCASCHGVHDIRPSSDPKSMIYKDNLQKTCGNCHPGASKTLRKGRCILLPPLLGGFWREGGWVGKDHLHFSDCSGHWRIVPFQLHGLVKKNGRTEALEARSGSR